MSYRDSEEWTEPGELPGLAHASKGGAIEVDVAREAARRALFGLQTGPRSISRFRLQRKIGSGGMGDVYAAHDPDLDRVVAIKLLNDDTVRSHQADARVFVDEARAMAKLSHPNVVAVYEAGVVEVEPNEDPVVFVAMEYVEGQTLRAWVERVKPSWEQIVAAYREAGKGLAAVHVAGMVHRDFKPDNVLVSTVGHRIKVTDFGLARRVVEEQTDSHSSSSSSEQQQSRARAGTLRYMAPEQLGDGVTNRYSDQFSFCVALHEAVYGRRPYRGDSAAELTAAFVRTDGALELPRTPLPARLRAVIRRGLALDPADRWESMDALLRALAPRRRRTVALLGVAAGVAGISWGAWRTAEVEPPCRGAAAALGEVWNESKAEAVRQSFGATAVRDADEAADRSIAAFDAYVGAWTTEHRSACEATRVHEAQPEAMLGLRMACLQRRRSELRSLVDALVVASPTAVQNSSVATHGLVSPELCREAAYLGADIDPPEGPEQTAAVDALRAELDRLGALSTLGDGPAAREAAVEALALAEAVDYGPALAEAQLLAARFEFHVGDHNTGQELLQRAYSTARAHNDSIVAANAALELSLGGQAGADTAKANEVWLRVARAEAARDGLSFEPDLMYAEAAMHVRAGNHAAAIEAALAGVAAIPRPCHGAACGLLAQLHSRLRQAYTAVGKKEESLVQAKLALDVVADDYPDSHPFVAELQSEYGQALCSRRLWEEAIVPLEAATQTLLATVASGGPNRAMALHTLGRAYLNTDRFDDGVRLMKQGIAEAREFDDPLQLASMLNSLAGSYGEVGRKEDARVVWNEALQRMRAAFPDGHPAILVLVANIGSSYAKEGMHEQALVLLEQARALLEARGNVSAKEAPVYFRLSRSLRDLGRYDEALVAIRRGVELTADGTPTLETVLINIDMIRLLASADPSASKSALATIRARCDATPEALRKAAGCELLDEIGPPVP